MTSVTFTYHGTEFQADWLNDERSRLSVSTAEPTFDELGINQTDWPSDELVSQIVDKHVEFADAGDAPDRSEAIYHAEADE